MAGDFKTSIKKALQRRIVHPWRQAAAGRKLKAWRKKGCPLPPPHELKQQVVKEYAKRFGTDILVETGTYKGAMVYAQLYRFRKIVTIELGKELYEKAKANFSLYPHVEFIQGDSAEMLPWVLQRLDKPALFWLDGHYSGGVTTKGKKTTPIKEELEAIFSSPLRHIILIDDARLFNGTDGYPTLAEVRHWLVEHRPGYNFEVANDIIRLYPAA